MNKEQLLEVVRKKSKLYHTLFSSPNGKKVLADLEKQFGGTTLKKVDKVIDPHASIAAAGAREVILYIKQEVMKHAAAE